MGRNRALDRPASAVDAVLETPLPGVRILPVVHDRVEMGAVVRRVLQELRPDGLAVELPTPLEDAARTAVKRLPKISVVVSEQEGDDALAWVVAPGDPFAEALRWAAEHEVPCHFIDPDVPYLERHRDPVPDPYCLYELGPAEYLRLVMEWTEASEGGEVSRGDRQREQGMAYHLQQAVRGPATPHGFCEDTPQGDAGPGLLLALAGAAHAGRVARALGSPTAQPFARPRRSRVTLRHLHPESLTGLLHDAPLAHGVYELLRGPELPPEPSLEATRAPRLSLVKAGLRLISRQEESWSAPRKRRVVERAAHRAGRKGAPDRHALGRVVWSVAAASYAEQTRESTERWQERTFFDFSRRYARAQGQLVPGVWEWVVAARGVADDNLAWEVFETARCYPWQEERAEIETARLDGEELDLGTRKVTFRRRFFRVKERPVPVRRRPTTDDPAEWLRGFDGATLCSFPPEDLVVEDWGRYLRTKAARVLAAERSRSEPFSTGMLDGVDLRETLRHPEDDRVWVRESGRAPGQAGSVVVIFDRDREGARYPHLMTWMGEHDDESDMAFYSTHPAEQVVGPGILRATYGGFLMTVPRGRLYEVWRDPDYRPAREKAEVLLMAAVDYSLEKLVAHVGPRPPSEHMHRYAATRGKRIVHIPLGALSPNTVRKVRVLHILVGHEKRKIAGRYIW